MESRNYKFNIGDKVKFKSKLSATYSYFSDCDNIDLFIHKQKGVLSETLIYYLIKNPVTLATYLVREEELELVNSDDCNLNNFLNTKISFVFRGVKVSEGIIYNNNNDYYYICSNNPITNGLHPIISQKTGYSYSWLVFGKKNIFGNYGISDIKLLEKSYPTWPIQDQTVQNKDISDLKDSIHDIPKQDSLNSFDITPTVMVEIELPKKKSTITVENTSNINI